MLDYITIEGFKSFRSLRDLELGEINVLIGANGSGKSNFIGAFEFLNAIRRVELRSYILKSGGASRLLHFGPEVTRQVHFFISLWDEINQYDITLEVSDDDSFFPKYESAYFWKKGQHERPFNTTLIGIGTEAGLGSSKDTIASHIRSFLDKCQAYHFHNTGAVSPFRVASDLHDNRFLRSDGSNLASYLYYLHSNQPDSYERIRESIEEVAPFFDDFELQPSMLNPDIIRLEWIHKGSNSYFDASSLSDGTLRFMALTTLFLQPESLMPAVILLDEPELGLHPYAIAKLAGMVKRASSNSQVIIATQSPILVDHFDPEDVLVSERVNGQTEIARLESERLESWLEDYSLGQLWEKNEIGGRPVPEYGGGA